MNLCMVYEGSKNLFDMIKYIVLIILALLLAVIAFTYVSDDASRAKIMGFLSTIYGR
jgi:hypothetical protein